MLDLLCIDFVILTMRPNPLDPDDSSLKIDRCHQAICVPLDVEDDTLCIDNARGSIRSPDLD
jgi:hypothetical protein